MMACPSCGAEVGASARFCAACGSDLAAPEGYDPPETARRESRRTVTILFADVVGSTALAESVDPEAMRVRLARFYAFARTTIEFHGGTVEKFIGDAVMAVFGIPDLHEDDALRASRAAEQLRDGAELPVRIGVNTGEVIVGDPLGGTTLVTGDPVNVAARLQTAAEPGSILIGGETLRLIRDRAEFVVLEPLALKGKSAPITAGRLLGVGTGHQRRRTSGPFVGRDDELARLRAAFEACVADRQPSIATVLGQPGVGKSRLVHEFTNWIGPAGAVLTGRCLSYGSGITYWPIGEIVRTAAGIGDRDAPSIARGRIERLLGSEPDAATVAGRVAAAIGLDPSGAVPEETPWAIRRLFEGIATERPLTLIVDDIQWAEPALLDLIEYIVGWATDVPLLIVCVGRSEFRDMRPDWGEAAPVATSIRLDALGLADASSLLDTLAGRRLPDDVRDRIVSVSDGNPLFAEELLTMLIEDGHLRPNGHGRWRFEADLDRLAIPPTIGALLASRLDRLPAADRQVLSRSAVVGERFDRAAAVELASGPDRGTVPGRLLALVRRELLRPDRSDLIGGEAFRFRHALIRDAAYDSLPKADRAVLHERLADWLVRVVGERVGEIEAIVGYHYERARTYRLELAPDDRRALDLGSKAAAHLGSAGRRSIDVGDMEAAVRTLGRARDLLPSSDPFRVELAGWLGVALFEVGRSAEAVAVTGQALADARVLADEHLVLRAEVEHALARLFTGEPASSPPDLRVLAGRLADLGDLLGEARAWQVQGQLEWFSYNVAAALEAFERARVLARAAGDRSIERQVLAWGLLGYGPTPVSSAIEIAQAALLTAGDDSVRRVAALVDLALLHAQNGDRSEARNEIREAREIFGTLGRRVFLGASYEFDIFIEWHDGDLAAAARGLAAGIAQLEALDAVTYLPFDYALLAYCHARLGHGPDAMAALDRLEITDSGTDRLATSFRARSQAYLAAGRGEREAAMGHAHRGASVLEGTDMIGFKGDALLDNAVVLRIIGEGDLAARSARKALELYEAKVHRAGIASARAFLESHPPPS